MPHHINITAQNQKLGIPVFKGIPSFVYYSNSGAGGVVGSVFSTL